jgi:protein SHQ1
MPITPSFILTQDDTYIYVTIKVPHIKVSAAEIHADGKDFSFYCKPYLLHLTLPYDVIGDEDDERQKATYDPDLDNGTLVAYLPKAITGQHFPDLDLTTCILNQFTVNTSKGNTTDGPIIEVLSSSINDSQDMNESAANTRIPLKLTDTPFYGFNGSYSNVLQNLREECVDMIEITEPDRFPANERREYRVMMENSLFDASRYLGDLFEAENDTIYVNAMDWEPFWTKIDPTNNNNDEDEDSAIEHPTVFTQSEQKAMTSSLRNKEYLIDCGSADESNLLLDLIDIIFSFCYEFRITLGDLNVVSSFNISRMSSILSWFDHFDKCEPHNDTMLSVIRSCMRRSIIYPYIRNWEFGMKVLEDVAQVFKHGKRCILKCLLKSRSLFEHGDSHYLLNKLYLNDYCVWIQTVADKSINEILVELNDAIEQFKLCGKHEVGFHLEKLEEWAHEQLLHGHDGGAIPNELLEYEKDSSTLDSQLEKMYLVN